MTSFDITPYINNCDLKNHQNAVNLPTNASYIFGDQEFHNNHYIEKRTHPITDDELEKCEAFIADFFKRWPSYTYNTKPYTPAAKAIPPYSRKLHPFKLSSISKALDTLLVNKTRVTAL